MKKRKPGKMKVRSVDTIPIDDMILILCFLKAADDQHVWRSIEDEITSGLYPSL